MEKLFEITDDILYRLFKDIPKGIAPKSPGENYSSNIYEPCIDFSGYISNFTGIVGSACEEIRIGDVVKISEVETKSDD